MASSSDFKKFFEKYQEEGAPNGVSIVKYLINAFCEVMRGNQDCSTYAPEALVK